METKTKIIIPLLLLCVGICAGMMLTRSCQKPKEIVTEVTIKDSTVVRVDTNRYEKPKPVSSIITGEYFTPFIIKQFLVDTVYVRDTIYFGGQTFYQEVKEYEGKDYYAKISGINAFLEKIDVFPETVTKYVYKEKKVVESPDKWVLYGKAEYESIAEQTFAKIGGGLEYRDKGNTFSAEGGKEFISGQWYFKGIYKREIFGWK